MQNNQSYAKEFMGASSHLFISKESFAEITRCKEQFLSDLTYDPRGNPYVCKEITESWARCRENHLDYNQSILNYKLTDSEFAKVRERYKLLLEITEPIFRSFKDLAISNGYGLYLVDRKGTFLFHEGGVLDLPIETGNTMVGMRWNERDIGTTAHTLALRHDKPFNVYGKENYYKVLENIVASAAPIHSEQRKSKIIAAIVLAQPITEEPWRESFQNLCTNALGLITAIATAVESQLDLKKSFNTQKITTEMLNLSLSMMDEGIITIDRHGKIVFCNDEGLRILKLSYKEARAANIQSFLSGDSGIMDSLAQQREATLEEAIIVGQDSENYIINIRLIHNPDSGQTELAVLILNNVNKVNTISTRRAGTVAHFTFNDIIGDCQRMQKVIRLGKQYAAAQENILLIGESGTGKEVFSQAIHNRSYPQGPFVAVNCAAMPRELIESELFGYEGGSFTGANRSGRPGKIELAEGGTLFLDEIGDMPLELQAVLLRVLQDKQVTRIGARRSIRVNFRLIAATNQDLRKLVEERLFREDLYYRLSVLKLVVPPLRERSRDILLLAQNFLEKYSQKTGRPIVKISPEAKEIIEKYSWPGNVRELENTMVHAVVNSDNDVIGANDLPEDITQLFKTEIAENFYQKTIKDKVDIVETEAADFLSLNELESIAIRNALTKAEGNVVDAAILLGLGKSTLYRKIKEYDIKV